MKTTNALSLETPPVTDPSDIIVLLSFVRISKPLNGLQMILDPVLMKGSHLRWIVFCLWDLCREPKHARGSLRPFGTVVDDG